MQDQLDSDRDNDRRLREQIDPLVGELTPIGKIELASRLIGESMIDSVRLRRPAPVIEAAPVRVVRMLPAAGSPDFTASAVASGESNEEGEREEAPKSGSPHGQDDDAIGHDNGGGST